MESEFITLYLISLYPFMNFFSGSTLIETDFTNSNLLEADFTSANIMGAKFDGANLTRKREKFRKLDKNIKNVGAFEDWIKAGGPTDR